MKRFLYVSFLGLGLCLIYATISYSRIDRMQRRQEKAIVLVPTGMPLSVGAATTTLPDGRDMSSLTYTLTNNSAKHLSSAQISVFIVGTCNCIKAAEGWRETLDIGPYATKTFSVVLKHPVRLGSRPVVALQTVTGEAGKWDVPLAELSKSAKGYASNGRVASVVARYSAIDQRYAHAPQTTGTCGFCDGALGSAKETCGEGKVASFSCDCKAQSYSFTCKGDDEYLLVQ